MNVADGTRFWGRNFIVYRLFFEQMLKRES